MTSKPSGASRQLFARLRQAILLSGLALAVQMGHAQTFKALYSFTGGADGALPRAPLAVIKGKVVGSTPYGGVAAYPNGNGTIVEVDPTTGQETTLYAFPTPYGLATSSAGMIGDSAGNLYGASVGGGSNQIGSIFELSAAGLFSVLYSFTGEADGRNPHSGLTSDLAGDLYGTTVSTAFRLDPAGTLTTLCAFPIGHASESSAGPLLLVRSELFGTVIGISKSQNGNISRIDAHTGKAKVIYKFRGEPDGSWPRDGVITDGAGNLYGVTLYGGQGKERKAPAGHGAVFKLDLTTGQETILHSLANGDDGKWPTSLVRDSAGNLYGTANSGGALRKGLVFKIDTVGNFSVLYNFAGGADGSRPFSLAIAANGNLYGETSLDGISNCHGGCGGVFELIP
jgi:uncharacterized repeat protein (TIGR03803 family)